MNKEKNPKGRDVETRVFGIGWYKESQWDLLLKYAVDSEDLEATHNEWLQVAHDGIANALSTGITCEKIPVDVQEMIDWCKDNNLSFDGESRSAFIAMKTKEKFS